MIDHKEDGPVTDEYVMARFDEVAASDFSHWEEQHDDWNSFYRLYGGRTLTDDDRESLIGTKRLPVELPMSTGIFNTIIGLDQNDRREVQFRVENESIVAAAVSGWITTLVRRAQLRCDAHRFFGDAGLDCAVIGVGCVEVHLDAHKIPRLPVVRSVRPWEVFVDCTAHEANFQDKRHVTWRRRYSRRRFFADFPDYEESSDWIGFTSSLVPRQQQREDVGQRVHAEDDDQAVYVNHFEFERFEPSWMVVLPDGARMVFAEYELEETSRRLLSAGIDVRSLPREEYRRRVIYRTRIADDGSRGLVLEKAKLQFPRFTIETPTCFRRRDLYENRTYVFGLGSIMQDAQKFVNLGFRIVLEFLARASKVGGFIEEGALRKFPGGDINTALANFQRSVSTPAAWIVLRDRAISDGKIMLAPPPVFPQGFDRLLQILIELLGKLTGVTEYVQGTSARDRAAILVSNLQASSMIMLSPLFDGINLARMNVGKVVASLILRHVDDDWINRSLPKPVEGVTHRQDPRTGEFVEVAKPAQVLRSIGDVDDFEVVSDVGQASMTNRMATWELLSNTAVLQSLIQDPTIRRHLVPMTLRNMPLQGEDPQIIGDKVEAEFAEQDALRRAEGVLQALLNMQPEERDAIIARVQSGETTEA